MGKSALYKNSKLQKLEKIGFTLLAALMIAVLFLSAEAHNIETKSRDDGKYIQIEDVELKKMKCADAPIGIVSEYRFMLGRMDYADMLAFYMNHNNIEVYLAEECVYRLEASEDSIQTTGGVWVMLPLYESDAGKEVRVVLKPLYADYQDKVPEFLVGDKLVIYKTVFNQVLPTILLGFVTMLVGIFLICLAGYHSIKSEPVDRLYAIGLLAVSAGTWRFSYERGAYLLLEGQGVFVFTLSVISLMGVALTMLYSVRLPEKEKNVIHLCSAIYGMIYSVQLLLQILGVADLRQTLGVIHITILNSAVFLFGNSIYDWKNDRKDSRKHNYIWLVGAGVVIDLLLYYFSDTSLGMLFTVGAILLFSLLEGIGLVNSYAEQKIAFEEMEMELTLSRTTTMMSQIRSHFVFNLLNAISGMCKYDPEKADDTVVRFARYLRNNIDIMEDDKNIPFASDLKQLEDYVELEQVRFGDKVEFYTDIETVDFMIPPLIIQPVVENAIKHGISKKKGNGTIILRTRQQGENVLITIEDDGIGFEMAELDKEKSVGLKNIRFRLEHLVNGTFSITSEVNVGTVVTITIPKNNTGNIYKTEQ